MTTASIVLFLAAYFLLTGGPGAVLDEFLDDVVSPGGLFAVAVAVAAMAWLRRREKDRWRP